MKNLTEMMKKAQAMQSQMADMQAEMDNMNVEGVAGAGMVKVVLSGKGDMKSISIDDSLFSSEEREVLEDLIIAARCPHSSQGSRSRHDAGTYERPDGWLAIARRV